MVRANDKRMLELKVGLDTDAVASAWKAGQITERQARNLVKFIAQARRVRENPIQTVLFEDDAGHYLGEADPLPDGTWRARRYGPDFKKGGLIVSDQDAAERYVRGEEG